MSTFGTCIPISLFGESHGKAIGITLHGLPGNIPLNLDEIQNALERRKPRFTFLTHRVETDAFTILSGFKNGVTTGSPLTITLENKDIRPEDYKNPIARPGHSDYPAYIKHQGSNDLSGGGHFSGRLTAPLVILGDIARQILAPLHIDVVSTIRSIHEHLGEEFDDKSFTKETIKRLLNSDFPTINLNDQEKFIKTIENAKNNGDSVGGTIQTAILNLPIGLGEPFFDSFESILSHLLFSVPSVKGLSFGKGFELSKLYGSQSNDPLTSTSNTVTFTSNNMGGVLGGLSTGQPLIYTTAIKPTPSITLPQETIHLETKKPLTYALQGRHDTCIVPRALTVINALSYYTTLELLIRKEGWHWLLSKH